MKRAGFVVGFVWMLAACGSDDTAAGGTGGSDAGADAAGGNDAGGTGGASGSSGADAGKPTCATVNFASLHGTVEGAPLTETWEIQAIGAPSTNPFHVAWEYKTRGYEEFRGTTPGDPLNLSAGTYPLDFGIVFPPKESALFGRALCVGGSVFNASDTNSRFIETTTAELLPKCPAGGGGETITLCSSCPQKVVGTLEGKTLDGAGLSAFTGASAVPHSYVQLTADQFALRAFTDTATPPATSGVVEHAIFFTYPESPFGAAAFCVTGPSKYSSPATGGYEVELTGVVRMGSCSPSGGSQSILMCR